MSVDFLLWKHIVYKDGIINEEAIKSYESTKCAKWLTKRPFIKVEDWLLQHTGHKLKGYVDRQGLYASDLPNK